MDDIEPSRSLCQANTVHTKSRNWLRKQQTSSFTKANSKVYASNEKQVLSPEVSEKNRQIVADMEDFANIDETDRSAPLGANGKINKPYLICVIKCQIP